LVQKKEKVRDKLDLLVQSIQIGENKKWISASNETAFTKLMVKALFTKSPKEIQIFIEEKKKGTENKLRTKIKYGDLKWMQIDEAKNTIMILTHLPTPFEIGERGENARGVSGCLSRSPRTDLTLYVRSALLTGKMPSPLTFKTKRITPNRIC